MDARLECGLGVASRRGSATQFVAQDGALNGEHDAPFVQAVI